MASFLTGLKLDDWLRLLRDNHPAVDRGHLARAAIVTLAAFGNSMLARLEPEALLTPELEAMWRRPLLILGLPRSGTTFLHQLLAANPELACPTRLECFNPWTFLTLHRLGITRFLNSLPQRSRGIDQVQVGWSSPEEDEFALTALLADGPWMGAVFPGSKAKYRRHYSMYPDWEGASSWQEGLNYFTRKLVWEHRRPLVLKSPLHTGRIPDLLSVFPEARVLTIFRDPRDQWQSALGTTRHSDGHWPALQNYQVKSEGMYDLMQFMLDRYFQTRDQIPEDRLLEVTYEKLLSDTPGVLGEIHEKLNLSGLLPTLQGLERDNWLRSYRPNQHPELTQEERSEIVLRYRSLYEAGYYQETLRELS